MSSSLLFTNVKEISVNYQPGQIYSVHLLKNGRFAISNSCYEIWKCIMDIYNICTMKKEVTLINKDESIFFIDDLEDGKVVTCPDGNVWDISGKEPIPTPLQIRQRKRKIMNMKTLNNKEIVIIYYNGTIDLYSGVAPYHFLHCFSHFNYLTYFCGGSIYINERNLLIASIKGDGKDLIYFFNVLTRQVQNIFEGLFFYQRGIVALKSNYIMFPFKDEFIIINVTNLTIDFRLKDITFNAYLATRFPPKPFQNWMALNKIDDNNLFVFNHVQQLFATMKIVNNEIQIKKEEDLEDYCELIINTQNNQIISINSTKIKLIYFKFKPI